MAGKRALPPVYFLASLLGMLVLHFALPIRVLFAAPHRYWGVLPIVAGVLVLVIAAGLFEKANTPIKPFEKSTHLVVEGPFVYSRNPMYLGMLVTVLGTAIVLGSVTPFLVIPALYLVLTGRFIRVEERALEQTFGEEYLAYKKKVRRWI